VKVAGPYRLRHPVVAALLLLVAACLIAFAVGGVRLSFSGLWSGAGPEGEAARLVARLRAPRIGLAAIVGAALALAGAALFYQSPALLTYACVFLVITPLFVVGYEEPTLRRLFGEEYREYCGRVGRWWPKG